MITIEFNFDDPSKLEISQKALFRIKIKEPSLLKTELTMAPTLREQIFGGRSYYEQSIPSQIVDMKKAKL